MKGLIIFFIYATILSSVPMRKPGNTQGDTRAEQLAQFLSRRESPLVESAVSFVQTADKYHLDWTLLPAIAGVESGFERAGNVHDFNAWGYMCGGNPCVFRSYDEGIETVSKTLATGRAYARFRESGSIEILAETYNQSNPVDWTGKVEYFQSALKGGE
jgi:hypothetical protein